MKINNYAVGVIIYFHSTKINNNAYGVIDVLLN